MSDHPYLEKLPHGVRDMVRQVFRNSENGTPGEVSQMGYVAIAKLGREVWNAWQENYFSVVEQNYTRYLDFSGMNFNSEELNFFGFEFPNKTDFSHCTFSDDFSFTAANFGSNISFVFATFGDQTNFDAVVFNGTVDFSNSSFGFGVNFKSVCFKADANFKKAQFDNAAIIVGCQFESADFSGAQFLGLSTFRGTGFAKHALFVDSIFSLEAKFEGSFFGKYTSFARAKFRNSVSFSATTLREIEDSFSSIGDGFNKVDAWIKLNGLNSDKFDAVSFENVIFYGDVDFHGRKFLRQLSLKNTRFLVVPTFYECSLPEDTSIENTVFPSPTGSDSNARAYRKLKESFSKKHNFSAELRFFRLEMAEEAAMATGFQRFLYKAYSLTSDYGFSLSRPLGLLGVALLIATTIYGVLSWQTNCSVSPCEFSASWIEFSLLQALPLPGLDKLSDAASTNLFGKNFSSIALTVTVILHKATSLLALFLIGLGLRNLFKLK